MLLLLFALDVINKKYLPFFFKKVIIIIMRRIKGSHVVEKLVIRLQIVVDDRVPSDQGKEGQSHHPPTQAYIAHVYLFNF